MPVFGLGIRPRGPSTLPKRPTTRIMSGRGDDGVEVEPAALDLLGQLLAADEVGARLFGFADLLAAGEDQHAERLAQAVRQHDGAAHHLVGVLGIDAEAQGDLDGLVELGEGVRLGQPHRLAQADTGAAGSTSVASAELLPVLDSFTSSPGSSGRREDGLPD